MQNKYIALFIGPSGAGKTTIANYLHDHYGLTQIESYTTRPPRYEGETGHVFISDKEFDQLTDLVAYTEFDGHRYCATAAQVEENDIYVVDLAGAEYFHEVYHGDKTPIVFYITAPEAELKRRMLRRGDGGLTVAQRMENDKRMFTDAGKRITDLYQKAWLIINQDVEQAAKDIMTSLRELQEEQQ